MTPETLKSRAAEIAAAYGRLLSVAAVFLGGSLASGKADNYSDIDLYVVAREDALPTVLGESRYCLGSCGELLFLERVDHGFPMDVFIYSDGSRGEVGFGTMSTVNGLHAGAFEVLFDPDQILQGHRFPGWASRSDQERNAWVEQRLRWFWREAIAARGYLGRGALWSAAMRLGDMRGILAAVAQEGGGSGKFLENYLAGAFFTLDTESMRNAFQALCALGRTCSGRNAGSDSAQVLERLAALAVSRSQGS